MTKPGSNWKKIFFLHTRGHLLWGSVADPDPDPVGSV